MKRRELLRSALGLPLIAGAAAAPRPAAAGSAKEGACRLRGTCDMGVVVERASGSLLVVDTSARKVLARVEGLGDLSHASVVYGRSGRFAYVFGRDGGLSKVDILNARIERRILQSGNSIGGAISDDGRLIAVSNYKPGGVKVFDADTLEEVADIPATHAGGRSKVVGLVDAPGRRFIFSLYDAGEIWMADFSGKTPEVIRIGRAGRQPYDGLIAQGGRIYIAGLFGEDGLALVDLWEEPPRVRRILRDYGRGERRLPVYKMPHLEGWAEAAGLFFLPAIGRHEVLVADGRDFRLKRRIPVHGQPVFAMARPDGRHVWVNFAHPDNDTVQVIDVKTLKVIRTFRPGRAVLHMEFTPRGEQVWLSVRDAGRVEIYDTHAFEKIGELPARSPSGIFFTARAGRIGL
jgi:protein NirF